MTTFSHPGHVITYTNSGTTTIAAGSVIDLGALLAVAIVDILAGESGAVAISGVHSLPAATGAWALGDPLYWNGTALETGSTGNTAAGMATTAKATATTTGSVLLNNLPGGPC